MKDVDTLRGGVALLRNMATQMLHAERTMLADMIEALAAERDALRERADLTWFWAIVDRDGLTGLPSDEREALSRLVSAAADRDAYKRNMEAAADLAARYGADRDAARAEVARLKAYIESALLELDDAGPKAVKYAAQDLRAALAADPQP